MGIKLREINYISHKKNQPNINIIQEAKIRFFLLP